MYLIFFDEVKQQPDYPYYHIGAICIHEDKLKEIENEVNNISQSVFNNIILCRETEFHAQNIFYRSGLFKKMIDFEKRQSILISLFEILEKIEIDLIHIQININSLLYADKKATDMAFMFLCEKANNLMKHYNSLGMLIGDRDTRRLADKYSVALSKYRNSETLYDYKCNISNLVESVHFTESHLSRFLQLADIYSWVVQFKNRHKTNNTKYKSFFEKINEKNLKLYPKRYKIWPSS